MALKSKGYVSHVQKEVWGRQFRIGTEAQDATQDPGSSCLFSSTLFSVGIGSHDHNIVAASPSITSTSGLSLLIESLCLFI